MVQQLKHAEWSEQLLAQELCEEMSMCVMESDAGQSARSGLDSAVPPSSALLLFRGLRLKVGLDVGEVRAPTLAMCGLWTLRAPSHADVCLQLSVRPLATALMDTCSSVSVYPCLTCCTCLGHTSLTPELQL